MFYLTITGIAFYAAGVFIERKLDAKGLSMISREQIEILYTQFTNLRKQNSFANLLLIIAYLFVLLVVNPSLDILVIGYVTLYLIIFLIVASAYLKKLRKHHFPQSFIRNFIGSKFIRVLAFGTFVTTVFAAVKQMD